MEACNGKLRAGPTIFYFKMISIIEGVTEKYRFAAEFLRKSEMVESTYFSKILCRPEGLNKVGR